MTDTQVEKRNEKAVQSRHGNKPETVYLPDVDISENGEKICLTANMPGVDKDSVNVTVENNTLTIEAEAHLDEPEGYTLAGQEYGIGRYRRDFTLSNAVDTQAIKARMDHGVLELTIPKREEVKTRKVKIEA